MTIDLKTSLRSSLSLVRAEIAALQSKETALLSMLDESPAPEQKRPAKAAKTPKAKRLKAPTGTLALAILEDLKGGAAKTNSALRASIKSSGYKYALNAEGIRQVCVKLRDDTPPKIKAEGEGANTVYSLA